MSLIDRIQEDLKTAMRERNELARETLRMVTAELKNRRIEVQRDLEEADVLEVLGRCVKTRRDSAQQYDDAGRPELADKERAEILVIEGYLPAQLGEEEAREAVASAIAEAGATSMKDMGAVMKVLMAKYKGRLDGKAAQGLLREQLGA
jgi:uncharacterized protein YqeY